MTVLLITDIPRLSFKAKDIMDLGLRERALATARDGLDHRFLDDVEGLGPATMENLARWIWTRMAPSCAGLAIVAVYRDSSGDTCRYYGP